MPEVDRYARLSAALRRDNAARPSEFPPGGNADTLNDVEERSPPFEKKTVMKLIGIALTAAALLVMAGNIAVAFG